MTNAEFLELLDRYGTDVESWPEARRAAARALLDEDEDSRRSWEAALAVDEQLSAFQPALPDLSARIMAAIPDSRSERLLAWLFPGGGASLLRPLLAGALPLIAGLVVGLSLPPLGSEETLLLWELEERELMAPALGEEWYD